MIKQLYIRNFQSHKRTQLEFAPGLNIIIGKSDSGKTAIIRALRWLIQNRPTGEGFRSWWGGQTDVQLMLDDAEITRLRNNAENGYVLKIGEDLQTDFKTTGTEVPDEIQRVLNMENINLQTQFDGPFLLSQSAGEVAQHFNRIARIDQIDKGMKRIQSWIRSLEQDIKSNGKIQQDLTEDLKQFDFLDHFEIDVESLEKTQKTHHVVSAGIGKLTNVIMSILEVQKEIESKNDVLKCEKMVNRVLTDYEKLEGVKGTMKQLTSIVDEIRDIDESIQNYQEVTQAENLVNSILGLYDTQKQLKDRRMELTRVIGEIQDTDSSLRIKTKTYKALTARFNREMPDVCPLCNQKVKLKV